MKILVTGAGGFLGRHLCHMLAEHGHDLAATDLQEVPHLPIEGLSWYKTEVGGLAAVAESFQPEFVVHAAFINRKPQDWNDLHYYQTVLKSDLPLFETCAKLGTGLLLVSSSAVYGTARGAPVIIESSAREPVTLYGVAKCMQELTAEQLSVTQGLKLSVLRLFNLIGPGQSAGMLLTDWVSRTSAIAAGAEPVLRVRNRATSRDFVDVRDAARAITLGVGTFKPGTIVNVASGATVSLMELSEYLRSLCPVEYQIVETAPSPEASDVPSQCGSNELIGQLWGWSPRIDWKQSLVDVWDYFQARQAQS